MKQPLSFDTIPRFKQIDKDLMFIEKNITTRMNYIFKTIGQIYNFTFDDFFSSKIEDEDGVVTRTYLYLPELLTKSKILVSCLEFENLQPPKYDWMVILNNKYWNLSREIPIKWLWEEFEEELINGKHLYDLKIIQKANTKKAKLFKSIKSKLSSEELKCVGL